MGFVPSSFTHVFIDLHQILKGLPKARPSSLLYSVLSYISRTHELLETGNNIFYSTYVLTFLSPKTWNRV